MPRDHARSTLACLVLALAAMAQQREQEEGGATPPGYTGSDLGELLVDGGAWEVLFDGETLDGWTPRGGRYDGDAAWTVEDGAIVGREGPGGAGGLLYTEKLYRNFELEAEMRITRPFDSGFFLRMTPPETKQLGAQVTVDWRDGGEVGAIYCDGYFLHNPSGEKLFRSDDWNRFRIRCAGDPMHLQVWLNGALLTDFRIPEDSGTFAPRGRIGLQVHGSPGAPEGSEVRFRALHVRELPDDAGSYFATDARGLEALTAQGVEAGWRALLDGSTLAGWEPEGDAEGYRVRDGVLELLAQGESPHLATERDYESFQLRLEFKIAKLANSGVFLRAARDGSNPAFSGCEIQILDDFHWEEATGTRLAPYQFTGSLYGSVPNPRRNAFRPIGEWNRYDVTFRGARIVVYLNGVLLYDVDTHAVPVPEGTLLFAERAPRGFLGLQRHAPAGTVDDEAHAWFRNLYVREL